MNLPYMFLPLVNPVILTFASVIDEIVMRSSFFTAIFLVSHVYLTKSHSSSGWGNPGDRGTSWFGATVSIVLSSVFSSTGTGFFGCSCNRSLS